MIKAKLKAAGLHLFFTALVAATSAAVIFLMWYPQPYTGISGGLGLWKILISVELTLGPLMSLVIYNPTKSLRTLLIDYSMVAIVQLGALIYGAHTLYQVRPLFMVFVKDRFELVTALDLSDEDWKLAKPWKKDMVGPSVIGVRKAEGELEQHELMFDTVTSGRDVQLRPKYYSELDYSELERAVLPINSLLLKLKNSPNESYTQTLSQYSSSHTWLPVVNGFNYWLAILDEKKKVVAMYAIDPWELQ